MSLRAFNRTMISPTDGELWRGCTSDASGVQDHEEMVSQEEQPGGHLPAEELDGVEEVAGRLNEGPTRDGECSEGDT